MNVPKGIESKTTTVGIRTRDYVVLAADKRASAGLYVAHKKARKIHRITESMAMTISGLVADAQYLVDLARAVSRYYELQNNRRPDVKAVATYLGNLLSVYLRSSPFIVQLLLGGYDTAPRLYYIDLFGTVSEENYMATGSGSPIAFGVLEKNYSVDMKLEDAIELAKKAVTAAIERDGFSGEGVDVVVIGRSEYVEKTYPYRYRVVVET